MPPVTRTPFSISAQLFGFNTLLAPVVPPVVIMSESNVTTMSCSDWSIVAPLSSRESASPSVGRRKSVTNGPAVSLLSWNWRKYRLLLPLSA